MDIKYEKCRMDEADLTLYEDSISTEDSLLEKSQMQSARKRAGLGPYTRVLVVHACYIVVYSSIAFILVHYLSQKYHGPGLIYSPAREAVEYEVHSGMDDYDNTSPYFGVPSPKLDQAWLDLIPDTPILLSEQEFRHYDKDGILLADGSGYLATITMYHDMHCIRYLHQTLYADYYFPNQTEHGRVARRDHSEHCLKSLKHGVTCHGDITVRTMKWEDDKLLPVATDNPHECVNAPKIDRWMKSRTVEAWRPGLLIHPILGPSFPNGIPD